VTENELEATRKRWNTAIKVVGMLILGFVVAPFIYVAIQGLIGLVLAAGVCLGINYYIPVMADKAANFRIKLIKAEAAKNPIETLQRDYNEKALQLDAFKESITKFAAATKTFKDKLDGFKDKFPKDADKFDETLSNMKQLLVLRKEKLVEAAASLDKYNSEIDRAKAIWDMGQEAAKMNKAAGMTEGDFLSKIKVETALDTVTTSMNMAFAELETSLEEEKSEKTAHNMLAGAQNKKQALVDAGTKRSNKNTVESLV
jgi:coenzyme F420-reducing hydrogenase delta subunit